MNCDLAKSHVFPYLDGELTGELREKMDEHLLDCGACRRLVDQEHAFRETYVARLRPDPAPPEHVALQFHLGNGESLPDPKVPVHCNAPPLGPTRY